MVFNMTRLKKEYDEGWKMKEKEINFD